MKRAPPFGFEIVVDYKRIFRSWHIGAVKTVLISGERADSVAHGSVLLGVAEFHVLPVHFPGSAEDALRAMTEQLIEKMNMRGISPFHLALSGAGTAQQMFGLWIREYREKIKWEQLRFYWVDERCVSPDDEESNFKHADELLFRPLDIPHAHVHRIHGEREPEVEAEHYSELVKWPICAATASASSNEVA